MIESGDKKISLFCQGGFTIIELMIVVAIAGILALLAMPDMQDTVANQRVRKAVSDMHLSLLQARSEAIKRNSTIDIVRTGASWGGGWTVETGGTVLRTYDALSSTLTFDCISTTCDTISITRSGRPALANHPAGVEFRVYVDDNERVIMRCVNVSLSGKPQVVVDGDNDTTNGCN